MLVEGPAGPEGPTVSHSASSSVTPLYFPPPLFLYLSALLFLGIQVDKVEADNFALSSSLLMLRPVDGKA